MFFFDFLILLVFFCCMGCERTTEKIIRDLNCKSAIETENGKTMDEELSEEELLHFNKMFLHNRRRKILMFDALPRFTMTRRI